MEQMKVKQTNENIRKMDYDFTIKSKSSPFFVEKYPVNSYNIGQISTIKYSHTAKFHGIYMKVIHIPHKFHFHDGNHAQQTLMYQGF